MRRFKEMILLSIFILVILLCSCKKENNKTAKQIETQITITKEETIKETSDTESINTKTNIITTGDVIEDEAEPLFSLNKRVLYMTKTKYEYLVVSFPQGYENNPEKGHWNTSNSDIAEVSEYGKVTAKNVGTCYITYTSSLGDVSGKCIVKVYEKDAKISVVWNKVDDMDSIKNGDIIVFGSPEFKMTASTEKKSGYLIPVNSTFSTDGNQILELDEKSAQFFVGQTDEENIFTLESQDGLYLAGRKTEKGTLLSFVKSKGQINWLFETPEGYEKGFCVNADLQDDYWLMFNKINSSDVRFNLYDSNESELMLLPLIYKMEVIIG